MKKVSSLLYNINILYYIVHYAQQNEVNPRFIIGIDKNLLTELLDNHKLVITLEDGAFDGGFGEKSSRFYSDKDMKVLNFGASKEFTDSVSLE